MRVCPESAVIRREDDVGGRARVAYKWWEASVAGRLNGDEVVQIWRFGGSEKSLSKWEKLVFNAFSYPEPVKRAKDQIV